MAEFKGIFACQLIGAAIAESFSGSLRLRIGADDAVVWFNKGLVSGITYDAFTGFDALAILAFANEGNVTAKPGPSPETDAGYAAMVAELVTNAMPAMPRRCPIMEYANLVVLPSPKADSAYRGMSFRIESEIKRQASLTGVRTQFEANEFWEAFFFLTATGALAIDYHPYVGGLLTHIQNTMTACLENEADEGRGAIFLDALHSIRAEKWPNWKLNQKSMASEGIAPYSGWARAIRVATEHTGATVRASRCYRQTLQNLSDDHRAVFEALLE